jgi:hypothetical protein
MSSSAVVDHDLEEKLSQALREGRSYDAMQYAQSFLARKRAGSVLAGPAALTHCLFAVRRFLSLGFPSEGGELLRWAIANKYFEEGLDVEHIADALAQLAGVLSEAKAEAAGQLAKTAARDLLEVMDRHGRSSTEAALLRNPVHALRSVLAETLGSIESWHLAVDVLYLGDDMAALSRALLGLASQGGRCELPLFFARAVLQLLSNGRVEAADSLLAEGAHIIEARESNRNSMTIAVWHFVVMLVDLIVRGKSLPPKERQNIYRLLSEKYQSIVQDVDSKLVDLAGDIAQDQGLVSRAVAAPSSTGGLLGQLRGGGNPLLASLMSGLR